MTRIPGLPIVPLRKKNYIKINILHHMKIRVKYKTHLKDGNKSYKVTHLCNIGLPSLKIQMASYSWATQILLYLFCYQILPVTWL